MQMITNRRVYDTSNIDEAPLLFGIIDPYGEHAQSPIVVRDPVLLNLLCTHPFSPSTWPFGRRTLDAQTVSISLENSNPDVVMASFSPMFGRNIIPMWLEEIRVNLKCIPNQRLIQYMLRLIPLTPGTASLSFAFNAVSRKYLLRGRQTFGVEVLDIDPQEKIKPSLARFYGHISPL